MKNDRTIRSVLPAEKDAWNSIVNHPLQTWEWGDFRASMGVDIVRLGVFEKTRLVSAWQMTFHKLPIFPLTLGYFPKGPVPTIEMISTIRKLAERKNAVYIQLEPDIPAETSLETIPSSSFRKAHHPLFTKYTFILDLTKTEEELMREMHPKTRYNIRVAERHGVVVREDNSDKAFSTYLRLSEETTHRQKFYAHNTRYHKTMWKILKKNGIARLFTAVYKNEIIAGWIVFCWKDTIYYPYGASSRNHKDVMAPNLLLWEIAKWAKKQGYFYFDLWGAMGPNPDTNDPWYGFHRFKEGYHPILKESIGSFDLVIKPFVYMIYTVADSVRWFLLNHKLF
jgi:lipid II:glycine glycyltransferase (peptidoglycan interpeptide bridge formation enzyme)